MTNNLDKPFLSIKDAAEYFGIGQNRFRMFIRQNRDADWLLYNGRKTLIKKKMLEDYINSIKSL